MNLNVGIVHAAGYVGRELITLVDAHPFLDLAIVASDSHAGEPVWKVHPTLRRISSQRFSSVDVEAILDLDVVILAGSHGTSFRLVADLVDRSYDGTLVDMTSDFRYPNAESHLFWTGTAHPSPNLLDRFVYGLPEISRQHAVNGAPVGLIANPGCFATALTLALWPLARHLADLDVHVTAISGASGAGSKPTSTTHFPRRDGNVRAYNPLAHRHAGEVQEATEHRLNVAFVPASGPWTRGIWGTAQTTLPPEIESSSVREWFHEAYDEEPFVRLWDDRLPELAYSVGTPFCDLGWKMAGSNLVIAFGLDNLLKGAASQAIQNVNMSVNLPEETGLIPPVGNANPVANVSAES